MAIIPTELTLIELCQKLSVTPSWIGKTIRELGMPQHGRGKTRIYSRNEYYILRNIRIMRMCNISWSYIKEVRTAEGKARKKIIQTAEMVKEKIKNGTARTKQGEFEFEIPFMLQPDVEIKFQLYEALNDKKEWIENDITQEAEQIINEQGLRYHLERIKEELKKIEEEIKEFYDNTPWYYSIPLKKT